jgi:REP element-mobilizing transposase RayT
MRRPYEVFEVTIRTMQGRFLLKPSEKINDFILGVIGRALQLYPGMRIFNFKVLSNHIHIILAAPNSGTMRKFMNHIDSNIAREAGRLHGWKDKFWSRRYRAIAIDDDQKLIERMHYIFSHGCKENLVASPYDWPGVGCEKALTEGQVLQGTWVDRTAMYEAERKGKDCRLEDFCIEYEVPLSRLPCFEDKPEEYVQAYYRQMIANIEADTAARLRDEDTRLLGITGVLLQDPHTWPEKMKKSPAPLCHASTRKKREEYKKSYRSFVARFMEAAEKLKQGFIDVCFPEGSFPPPMPAMIVATSGAPPG